MQARRAAVASLDTLISQAAEQAVLFHTARRPHSLHHLSQIEPPQTVIDILVEAMKDADPATVSKALAVVLLIASLLPSVCCMHFTTTCFSSFTQTFRKHALTFVGAALPQVGSTQLDVKEHATTLIRRAEQTVKLGALVQKMVDSFQTTSVPKVKAFV